MRITNVAGLVLFFCCTCIQAEPELKGSPDEIRSFLYPKDKVITLVGQSEERAYSDKAIISLVVTTEGKTLSTALAQNSKLRKSITSTLTKSGIKPDAIKSSRFSSSPEYGWFGKKPSSYKVINRLAITIDKEDQLQTIARVADYSTEVELADTAFEHTEKEKFNDKVKAAALERVLAQKAFYEESLGITLVPIGIRDTSVKQRATIGARMLEEVLVTATKRSDGGYSSVSSYDSIEVPSFDELFYEASMAVDFKISN